MDGTWEAKVLRNFFDKQGRLKTIPARQKKRHVVLGWLADHFKPAVRYPEAQVNEVLGRYHPDFASLRRALVDEELMQREAGIYWRAGTLPLASPGEPVPRPLLEGLRAGDPGRDPTRDLLRRDA